ncbi:hypothetical protein [uncultured Maribacter sp.]|uniref:hypothetical protein n=1 Tax=uncultured Maribacter sp. TaxID=431308 RepID=UPI00260558B7|nr:hypothetical protein [uncultured Maribacter sp.]
MKNFVVNLIMYGPVVAYIIYSQYTRVPNSGFNWVELITVIFLGLLSSAIARKCKEKWD